MVSGGQCNDPVSDTVAGHCVHSINIVLAYTMGIKADKVCRHTHHK